MAMATKILGFGGTLGAAALMYAIFLEPVIDGSATVVENTSLTEAQNGSQYVTQAGDWSGLIVLMVLGVALLGAAVYRSENP